MTALERKMTDHLKQMREEYNLIGIKTEFEGEGARMDELFRLKEMTMNAGVDIVLMIAAPRPIPNILNPPPNAPKK